MRTLFLNPPSFQGFDGGAGSRYQAKREVRSFWYPTWLAQAAALVPGSRIIDAPADELRVETVVDISSGYELVIIYTSTPSFANDTRVASQIKQRNPRVLIGFVGPHVTVLPEQSLHAAASVDFVVRREFELPVRDIAFGKPLGDVQGVSWKDGDAIRHNADADLLTDLDSLPFVVDVYKRDLTIDNYYIGYLIHPYLSIYTGRGCPGQCTYCLWPQTISGHQYRVRGAESVYQELAYAKELFPQVKEFFIDDDTFTANTKRAEEIAGKLATLGITWSTSSRANVPRETLGILKECGLRLLMVGYESGSDDILKNVRKGISTEMATRFTEDCKSLGIAIHGTFCLGLPGETRETIEETIRYACRLDPDTIQVSIASPYPGTELYQQALENGWLAQEDLVSTDGTQTCALRYPQISPEEIEASVDKFYKRFYFRPKVMARMGLQMAKDADTRRRRLREGREFLSFLKRHDSAKPNSGSAIRKVLRDGGPGFCQFAITNACNAHCQFCNFRVGSEMTGERIFVSLEDSKAAMRILADNGVEYVALVGGEPTLHPKLPEILQSAQSLGINTLISTNGSHLSDERVKEYANAGLGSAIISIDAPGVEAHEGNRGLPGVCKRIARANSEFHRLGVSTTASVTISKLLGDLSQLPAFLKSLNFDQVTFSYPLRSLDSSFLGFSDSEIIEFTDDELIAIFDTIIKMKETFPVVNPTASLREMQRFIRGEKQIFPCLAGFKYFHLDWNLDLYRCHAWPKKMCTIWDLDSSKLVRDGCTRCMIDCYRDASVLHNVGIALYDAKVDLTRVRLVMALTHVANRALYESAKSILEDFRWIKKLGAGRS